MKKIMENKLDLGLVYIIISLVVMGVIIISFLGTIIFGWESILKSSIINRDLIALAHLVIGLSLGIVLMGGIILRGN